MSLLIAEHETSGASLSWIFALLASHPDHLELCQIEANQTTNIESMHHINAVVHEALRLYPPGYTLFLQQATCDLDLAGTSIRKGDLLQIVPYITGRDPRFFEDPNAFRPERFMREASWPFYANIPFSAGPRSCTGKQFALKEVATIVAHLLRHFSPKLIKKFPEPSPQFSLRPTDGLPMVWQCL